MDKESILRGFILLNQLEKKLKEKGMNPQLIKFCILVLDNNKPQTDEYIAELSEMSGSGWRKKRVAELRLQLISWQEQNEELIQIETKDNKTFSYKSSENMNRILSNLN